MALGGENVRDVLVIAAHVDQEAGGLILDSLGRSVRGRDVDHEAQEAREEMVEVVMPVRKHSEVSEGEEDLCEHLWVSCQPENTNAVMSRDA